jgi:hypothetical protein
VFSFPMHPIAIGVSDGVQAAFSYLQISWRRWLPAILVVAVLTGIIYAMVGSTDTATLYQVDRETGRIVWYAGSDKKLWGIAGSIGAIGLVGLVATWVFTAAAIAGLRGRPMTLEFVVGRGLTGLAASILLGLAGIVGVIALGVLFVVAPPLGILALLAAIPVSIYLVIRVVFYTLAIFDGYGPIEGILESWRLSQGSVVRIFGWGLLAILISLGFSIVASIVGALFTGSTASIGRGLAAVATTTGSCFTVFMMAVLYESERARHDPAAYGIAAGPGYPPPYPGAPYPSGPAQYPGAPAWPTAGPYAGAQPPYPGGPTPYPALPSPYPGAQAPYPGAQAPYPASPYAGAQPPYPGAPSWPAGAQPTQPMSGWVVPQAPPVWPSPQPPASAWPPQNPVLPYQGATPAYPGAPPPRWGPTAGQSGPGSGGPAAPVTGDPAAAIGDPAATPAVQPDAPAEPSTADAAPPPEDPTTSA